MLELIQLGDASFFPFLIPEIEFVRTELIAVILEHEVVLRLEANAEDGRAERRRWSHHRILGIISSVLLRVWGGFL